MHYLPYETIVVLGIRERDRDRDRDLSLTGFYRTILLVDVLYCAMTQAGHAAATGHAFLSYVREDNYRVDRLQSILEAAGVAVWRDTSSLWPGEDWRRQIRTAITEGSLAFVACFSENSANRAKSYQNEELILAIEQMRLMQPGVSWLIPVRFANCDIPSFDLGIGKTLGSLQYIDLFNGNWELSAVRLVGAVLRILDPERGHVGARHPGREITDDHGTSLGRYSGQADLGSSPAIYHVQNFYYGEHVAGRSTHLKPFDLPGLRVWIDQVCSGYHRRLAADGLGFGGKETRDHLRQLESLQQSVSGSSAGNDVKKPLRRLAASGIVQYLTRVSELPTERVPDQVFLDIAVFSLWPIICAPELPSAWQQELAELTSPRVAAVVSEMRDTRTSGHPADVEYLAMRLSARPVAPAVVNLLSDLSEPGRGGAALTAIAVAAQLPTLPPQRGGVKATAAWISGMLAGGGIAIAASDLDNKLAVDGLLDFSHHHSASRDHVSSEIEHLLHGFFNF